MIFRFSLYSFLRRQEFFAPFIILAFLQKGLNFAQIGLLISLREVCINVLEIPSGAIADVLGRRKSLVFSLLGYIVSFILFGLAVDAWLLIPAVILYAVGESFRTGTHKAMLFAWVEQHGLSAEKKHIYGITRSWGKIGGALSVIPATALTFYTGNYSYVFYLSTIPFLLNAINIATYPSSIDPKPERSRRITSVFRTSVSAMISVWRVPALRAVIAECMCYESLFKLSKDYLQPVIKSMALTLPVLLALKGEQRTAIIIGAIYFCMDLCSAYVSRKSGSFADALGERRAPIVIWTMEGSLFGLVLLGAIIQQPALIVVALVGVLIKQNLWKPVLVCRCSDVCDKEQTATVLSIQSQAKTVMLAVLAPVVGYCVDWCRETDLNSFLPLGVLGLTISAIAMTLVLRSSSARSR